MRKTADKTNSYSDIGKRIQKRLTTLGKSQPWLAEQLKISQSAVSQMLRNPQPSKHLFKLAAIVGSPYEWLAYGKGPEITPQWSRKKSEGGFQSAPYTGQYYETSLEEATRGVNAFTEIFTSLSPEAQKLAAKMISSVIADRLKEKKT